MKRLFKIASSLLILFTLSGCQDGRESLPSVQMPGDMVENAPLVVYYSFTGEVERLSFEISKIVGGRTLRLETEEPYSDDYKRLGEQIEFEQKQNIHSGLKTEIENMENYDTIFLGTALWNGELPPAVRAFLTEYDFSGKTLVPFGVSPMKGDGSEADITRLMQEQCPLAEVEEGLMITGGENLGQEDILAWLAEQGHVIPIKVQAGEESLAGVLFSNPVSEEFARRLPLETALYQPADFAKAFNLQEALKEPASRTRLFELGGLVYWPEGAAVAIFFSDHVDRTVVPVYTMGKLLEDVELFREYEGLITITTDYKGMNVKNDFVANQILHGQSGDIHYSYYLPRDYQEDKKYPMMVVMPGYDKMWFGEESAGKNLEWNGAKVWTEEEEDMIIVSAQLTDWGETSARQALELTEYFITHFSVDTSRVYGAGYSAGGRDYVPGSIHEAGIVCRLSSWGFSVGRNL